MVRCLFLGTLTGLLALGVAVAHHWDRAAAQRALEDARRLETELHASAPAARTEQKYLECIRMFQRVYLKDPHYGGSDDALFAAANLYQEGADRFRRPDYLAEAGKLFQFLLSDYPTSRFAAEARTRGAQLHARTASAKKPAVADPPPAARSSAPTPALPAPAVPAPPGETVSGETRTVIQTIRHFATADYSRIVIDLDGPAKYHREFVPNPDRIFFDISSARLGPDLKAHTVSISDGAIKQVRFGLNRRDVIRIVLDFEGSHEYTVFNLHDPSRIMVDVRTAPLAAGQSREMHKSVPLEMVGPVKVVPSGVPLELAAAAPAGGAGLPTASPEFAAVIPAVLTQPAPSSRAVVERTDAPAPRIEPPARTAAKGSAKKAADAENQPPAGERKIADPLSALSPGVSPPPELRTGAAATEAPASRPESPAPPTKSAAKNTRKSAVPNPPEPSTSSTEKKTEKKSGDAVSAATSLPQPVLPKPAAPTTFDGSRTMTRMLGLKIGRIVLDPGHGGHDTGSIGKGGLKEKDLVLDVALELKKLLERKLGAEVVLTRNDDTFIPLEERTEIANHHHADLFVSIHANSSTTRTASGVETYYLNFARTEEAREIAARENATTFRNVRDLQDLVKKIAAAEKSVESRELASMVQKKLYGGAQRAFPGARNRGVRSAPFVVLIGANMPSILAEVGFVSNPRDEKLMRKDSIRQQLVTALYSGIESYMQTLGRDIAQR